ncbi:MAG TPA: 50S ribosomal protein L18e [Candidatus Nitrosotenuis sp.]|nr:50S ribosomal protein L18e [Candidatus Nitrosotenuis sp.]
MTNQLVLNMVKDLKKASAKNKAPIWSKLAVMAQKPSIARRIVNIKKINDVTKENDVVVVPGKVLGTGNMSHKITLCSFSISTSAAKKVLSAGGNIINYSEIISKFPTGKGVKIIG